MAGKIYEIAFKIGGQMSGGFSKSFASANKTVRAFGDNLNSLNAKAHALGKAHKAAEKEVEELAAAIREAGTPTSELANKFWEAENKLKGLTAQYNQAQAAAEKYRITQEKIAKTTELQNKMKGWASSSAMTLGAMGATGAGMAAATVMPAMAMEDAMADVAKVTDFDPKGLAEAQRQIEQMSLRVPMAATGLANIMASAAQSGVAKEELVAFTEQAAKMGVAFDISAEEAGTMMSKWRSGMGLTQAQVVSLADAANALSNENAATASQIGDVLMRYGAMGKVAGLTEKQVAAFATTVIASGAEAEVAATGIKAFMRQLGGGEKLSKKAQGYFSAVGLDPAELQKNLQKDAPAAIVSALEAIKKEVPKERWNEYLSSMFGEESAAAVGPMMANLDALKNNFKLVANETSYSGSMMKEFETRSKTASNALQLAKNATTLVAGNIGKALLPAVKKLSAKFVEVGAKVADFISKNQGLVLKVLKVTGVIVGFVAAFHALRLAFALTAQPFLAMYKGFLYIQSGALKAKLAVIAQNAAMVAAKVKMIACSVATKIAAAAQWVLNSAFWACPITWIIAGIVALIAIGILLYKNWDKIKAKTIELWQSFNEKFPLMSRIVQMAILPIKVAIQTGIIVFKLLKAAGIALWNGLKWCWNGIKSATLAAWRKIQEPLTNAWEKFKVFATYVKTKFVYAFRFMREKIAAAFSGLVSLVKAPFNGVITLVNKAIGAINKINVKIPEWAGGGSIGFNIAEIPMLAEGGIATKPTLAMIGEGRESEAVLPLSKLKGMLGGGGGMSVNFAPVINVSGGGDAYAGVKRGLEEGAANLKRELEKLLMNNRRLSYA